MPGRLFMRHAVHPFHHSFINIGSCPQIHILRNGVPVPAGKTRTASRLFRISQARAYLKAGKFRECADMCEQALKRFPNHAGVLETLDKARSSGK